MRIFIRIELVWKQKCQYVTMKNKNSSQIMKVSQLNKACLSRVNLFDDKSNRKSRHIKYNMYVCRKAKTLSVEK